MYEAININKDFWVSKLFRNPSVILTIWRSLKFLFFSD